MSDVKSVFYRRKFLNKPHFQSGAHVIAKVEREEFQRKDDAPSVYYYYRLKIADCDRVVSLDLGDDSPKERANTMFKLDTLINTLVEFRDAVIKAHKDVAERGE